MKPKFDFDDLYKDLMEHQKNLAEAIDANKIIDELIDTSFGGSNETQMKAVQLLKGLATSDDPASNAFMKKLDAWTSGLKKSEGHTERHYTILSESIKSDLDNVLKDLDPDSVKRTGKLVTITWKEGSGIFVDDISARLKKDLSKHGDKIKAITADKKGEGIVAHIEMN